MKKPLLLIVSTFVSSFAFVAPHNSFGAASSDAIKSAVENLSSCGNFIRFDTENVYSGFGTYWTSHVSPREPRTSSLRVRSITRGTETSVQTLDSAIDLVTVGKSTFVLTYSGIEEWDMSQKRRIETYRTHRQPGPLDNEEHPKSFALYKNKLVIAHGRLGLTVFDLATKTVTREIPVVTSQLPLESVVNGVVVSGRYAFAVLDSFSLVTQGEKPAFRGFAIVDLESETVVSQLDGLEPGADSLTADGNVAVLSFYGQPLLKYSLAGLERASVLPAPLARFWKFPITGKQVGKASMDDRYYYTCFSRLPKPGEGSSFVKQPMVFERKILTMD